MAIAQRVILVLTCWVLVLSLISFNVHASETPKLEFQPKPDQARNPGSTLIWVNMTTERSGTYWGKSLQNFLRKGYSEYPGIYGNPPIQCGFNYGARATSTQACYLEESTMLNRACSFQNDEFGYGGASGRPCVLIQLSNVYDWKPEAYATVADLELAKDRGMPAYLVDAIMKKLQSNPTDPTLQTIWVSCDGESPADKENIGNVEFYSAGILNGRSGYRFPGIPNYFFPYVGQDNYRQPFVFVKFLRPRLGVLINIECKAWAKNIDPFLSGHFELLID